MGKDQVTVFEALAIAGEPTSYAKRNKVRVIRPSNKGTKITEIDITDKRLIDSEFYYILPNDIIYIEPMKVKMFGFGETYSLGTITSTMSFILLIITLL